jgi:hypothetical protein
MKINSCTPFPKRRNHAALAHLHAIPVWSRTARTHRPQRLSCGTNFPAPATSPPTRGMRILPPRPCDSAANHALSTFGTEIFPDGTWVPIPGTNVLCQATTNLGRATVLPSPGTRIPAQGTQFPGNGMEIPGQVTSPLAQATRPICRATGSHTARDSSHRSRDGSHARRDASHLANSWVPRAMGRVARAMGRVPRGRRLVACGRIAVPWLTGLVARRRFPVACATGLRFLHGFKRFFGNFINFEADSAKGGRNG